jgi:hypothetical protein
VEQSLEGEGCSDGFPTNEIQSWREASADATDRFSGDVRGHQKRQEGRGAGDGELLHERNKALKGEPQERIRHETRPAGSERIKASRGRENLKAHGRSDSGSLITLLCGCFEWGKR